MLASGLCWALAMLPPLGGGTRGFDRRTRIAVPPERALPPTPSDSSTPLGRQLRTVLAAEAAARPPSSALPPSSARSASAVPASAVGHLHRTLDAAGYRPLTDRDVSLCRALNLGYLLRLSVEADVERLPRLDSAALGDEAAAAVAAAGDAYSQRVLVYVRG